MTSKKPFDDSNWRSEYLDLTGHRLSILQCEVLEQGPRSLAQSWMLGAMHSDWMKIKGYKYPDPPDCQSNLTDSLKKFDEYDYE